MEAMKAFVSQARALKAEHNLASRRDVKFFVIANDAAWATDRVRTSRSSCGWPGPPRSPAARHGRRDAAAVTPLGTLDLDLASAIDAGAEKPAAHQGAGGPRQAHRGTEARLANAAFVEQGARRGPRGRTPPARRAAGEAGRARAPPEIGPMPPRPRILAFCASSRKESLNRKFLASAVSAATSEGCDVTLLDLNDYVLPLYDGDLEDRDGMPANAVKLIGLISGSHGLLVASPEYNSMITPLLKNTIDWCTRGEGNPFVGKVAAVVSASPGLHGGARSLVMAQGLLLKLGCHVVPGQCILPHADKAFDANGLLLEEHSTKAVHGLAKALAATAARFAA